MASFSELFTFGLLMRHLEVVGRWRWQAAAAARVLQARPQRRWCGFWCYEDL